MKTIELRPERHHGAVAEAIKNLMLIVAGGATLSLVLILLQPLSRLQYHARSVTPAASPFTGNEQQHPDNRTAAAALPALDDKSEPPEKTPPQEDITPPNPEPANIVTEDAVTKTSADNRKALLLRSKAEQLRETKTAMAFLEENEKRNERIVKELSLVIDMHECHFSRASSEPLNDSLMALLDSSVAKCLQSPAGWSRIIVLGFTDNRGSRLSNIRLGMERAEKLKAILVDRGIPAERISTASFGAALPIDTNTTGRGRARNRRAEFNVLGQVANAGL